MHESERNRLEKRRRALSLAAADMKQAIAATEALEREASSVPLMLALETAIVVCYARPFTSSSLLRLPVDEYRPDREALAFYHDSLYEMRNRKYAHTDKDSERDALVLLHGDVGDQHEASSVGWTWTWKPLSREWLPSIRSLCEHQYLRFVSELLDIERLLHEFEADSIVDGGPHT